MTTMMDFQPSFDYFTGSVTAMCFVYAIWMSCRNLATVWACLSIPTPLFVNIPAAISMPLLAFATMTIYGKLKDVFHNNLIITAVAPLAIALLIWFASFIIKSIKNMTTMMRRKNNNKKNNKIMVVDSSKFWTYLGNDIKKLAAFFTFRVLFFVFSVHWVLRWEDASFYGIYDYLCSTVGKTLRSIFWNFIIRNCATPPVIILSCDAFVISAVYWICTTRGKALVSKTSIKNKSSSAAALNPNARFPPKASTAPVTAKKAPWFFFLLTARKTVQPKSTVQPTVQPKATVQTKATVQPKATTPIKAATAGRRSVSMPRDNTINNNNSDGARRPAKKTQSAAGAPAIRRPVSTTSNNKNNNGLSTQPSQATTAALESALYLSNNNNNRTVAAPQVQAASPRVQVAAPTTIVAQPTASSTPRRSAAEKQARRESQLAKRELAQQQATQYIKQSKKSTKANTGGSAAEKKAWKELQRAQRELAQATPTTVRRGRSASQMNKHGETKAQAQARRESQRDKRALARIRAGVAPARRP